MNLKATVELQDTDSGMVLVSYSVSGVHPQQGSRPLIYAAADAAVEQLVRVGAQTISIGDRTPVLMGSHFEVPR